MSILHRVLDRLADSLYSRRKVRLRFDVDSRIARNIFSDIERLLQDDLEGETYRCAVAHWRRADRPPLERYLGSVSLCRIDGPLQDAPADYPHSFILPSGGLIETPGITAPLTPVEADAIWKRIQEAIEREIVRWTSEHGLYDKPRLPPSRDQGHDGGGTGARPPKAEARPYDICCSDEPVDSLCKACRKGAGHE